MKGILIAIIIILLLLLVLAGIIYYAYTRIREKVRQFSTVMLGNASITEGIKQRDLEVANTPRSVGSATGLYLPQIMKDFPEFHYDEMKTRAENVLMSYLRCIDGGSAASLTEGTNELRDKLKMRIQMLKSQGQREHFESIRIHRTEIREYRKTKGRCSIVFQSAVQYIHYVEKDGQILRGRKDLTDQSKYNVEVIYIQDPDLVENIKDAGLAMNCPNCGAPLPGLGAKKCEYCDSPVLEINIRTWNFSSVKEAR
ncbi:MAG: zinc ribbon domain-containing protein [Lachnospiraceae bacterium]|nr:zinc ribbon domain-containing protein [Lachnospiraceae bacterium]